jgi:DNA-binding NarL/FixJ family response regulator
MILRKTRVLIVDDHPIIREALTALLSRQSDLEVCGEADGIATALQRIPEVRPDVVMVDLTLEDGNGLELIRRIALLDPPIASIACSTFDECFYAERALHAGALGYVQKYEATERIITAIRQAAAGKTYVSDQVATLLTQRMVGKYSKTKVRSLEDLSDREMEIYVLMGKGQTTAEIAKTLHIGEKTVDTHRRRIKAKLALTSNSQITCQAAQWVAEHSAG